MNKLFASSLRNVLIAATYIFAVSQIMNRGDQLFGEMDKSFIAPFAFLLLFSASAAIVGGLIFGQSIQLFLEGKKTESIQAAVYSVGTLCAITLFVLLVLIVL